MSEIDPYIRTLFLLANSTLGFSEAYMRREEIVPSISDKIFELTSAHNVNEFVESGALAEEIFDEMVTAGGFHKDEVALAGVYYQYSQNKFNQFRSAVIDSDQIARTHARIGNRFFPDVFQGFLKRAGSADAKLLRIPASDRTVVLGDKHPTVQIISELSREISSSNSINEEMGKDADQIKAEISAAVNLTKSERVSLSALIALLSRSLKYIAEKFAGSSIGELAKALIKQLLDL